MIPQAAFVCRVHSLSTKSVIVIQNHGVQPQEYDFWPNVPQSTQKELGQNISKAEFMLGNKSRQESLDRSCAGDVLNSKERFGTLIIFEVVEVGEVSTVTEHEPAQDRGKEVSCRNSLAILLEVGKGLCQHLGQTKGVKKFRKRRDASPTGQTIGSCFNGIGTKMHFAHHLMGLNGVKVVGTSGSPFYRDLSGFSGSQLPQNRTTQV